MTNERGSDAAGYLGWFFLGSIAGAAAALLLAPRTGRETRELLAERGSELLKKAQEKAGETQGLSHLSGKNTFESVHGNGLDFNETRRVRAWTH